MSVPQSEKTALREMAREIPASDIINKKFKKPMDKIIEIKFNIKNFENNPADKTEYIRQLKNQEKGLNKLTIKEYLDNIENYKINGRGSEAAKVQKKVRAKAFEDKVDELLELYPSKSLEQLEIEAIEWLETKAALHNPDMSAGGNPLDITEVGDTKINNSIGSQWGHGNAEYLESQIKDYIRNINSEQYTIIYLNVKLTY